MSVDAAFKRAIDAGAEVAMPLADVFWGDRYGKVTDPFGHKWSIATHVEDVPPEELPVRAAAAFGGWVGGAVWPVLPGACRVSRYSTLAKLPIAWSARQVRWLPTTGATKLGAGARRAPAASAGIRFRNDAASGLII